MPGKSDATVKYANEPKENRTLQGLTFPSWMHPLHCVVNLLESSLVTGVHNRKRLLRGTSLQDFRD